MVSPTRLKRAKEYASKNGLVDIFDALEDVRSEEVKRKYIRRKVTVWCWGIILFAVRISMA